MSSPYPQLPFNIKIALVQRRYHCFRQLRIFLNFNSWPNTRCIKPGYFPSRYAHCVYCTEKALTFLGSPYPQLPFDINIAQEQRRFHCFRQLRIFPNLNSPPYTRLMKQGYLHCRNAKCVYCTEKAIALLGSPFPQLPFDINIALVQRNYHCFQQLRSFPNFRSRTDTRCIIPGLFSWP